MAKDNAKNSRYINSGFSVISSWDNTNFLSSSLPKHQLFYISIEYRPKRNLLLFVLVNSSVCSHTLAWCYTQLHVGVCKEIPFPFRIPNEYIRNNHDAKKLIRNTKRKRNFLTASQNWRFTGSLTMTQRMPSLSIRGRFLPHDKTPRAICRGDLATNAIL